MLRPGGRSVRLRRQRRTRTGIPQRWRLSSGFSAVMLGFLVCSYVSTRFDFPDKLRLDVGVWLAGLAADKHLQP